MLLFASLLISTWLPAPQISADELGYQAYDLVGLQSPTAIVSIRGQWVIAADLNDLAPGIFRLEAAPKDRQWTANRIKSLPQLAIEGLAYDPSQNHLQVITERKFSVFEEDWQSAVHVLALPNLNPFDTWTLEIPNTCYSGLRQCGLSAMLQLDESHWLFFKKQQPSKVFLYQQRGREWRFLKSASIGVKRRHVIISDVQLVGDQVALLLKDRWALARIPLEAFKKKWPPSHHLEPFFSFKPLAKRYPIRQRRMRLEGIAEAFAIDDKGKLYLILNNRGFPYFSRREDTQGNHPKLIVFERPIADVE